MSNDVFIYDFEKKIEIVSKNYDIDFACVNMNLFKEEINLRNCFLDRIFTKGEIDYHNNLKNDKNKIQWLAGRYAVKSALFKHKYKSGSIVDLSNIDIIKGHDSAPYILQYPMINCTISHSHPFCVAAVSELEIGIDIEKEFNPADSLLKYYFCENERKVINMNIDSARIATMYWTKKEAISKVLRLGMGMDFKKIDASKKFYSHFRETIKTDSLRFKNFYVSISNTTKD